MLKRTSLQLAYTQTRRLFTYPFVDDRRYDMVCSTPAIPSTEAHGSVSREERSRANAEHFISFSVSSILTRPPVLLPHPHSIICLRMIRTPQATYLKKPYPPLPFGPRTFQYIQIVRLPGHSIIGRGKSVPTQVTTSFVYLSPSDVGSES